MEKDRITQRQAMQAYIALNGIRRKVKGHDALNLFHLKRQLQEAVDFQIEEEQKLVEEYGGKVTQEGQVIIVDDQKRAEFNKACQEMQDLEIKTKPEMPVISLDRNPDITLEDIEMLDGFIIFK